MQFLLSVHHEENRPLPPEDEMQKAFARVGEFNERLQAAGKLVFAGGLLPSAHATTLRLGSDDSITTTDGAPDAGPEPMGGFWVIDAADEAEAREWADGAIKACREVVVVRPFQGE